MDGPRWHGGRGDCPECNGTGYVIVMPPGGETMMPLKRNLKHWGEPRQMRCGFCGGDGRVDEWPCKPGEDPVEWFMERKRKLPFKG